MNATVRCCSGPLVEDDAADGRTSERPRGCLYISGREMELKDIKVTVDPVIRTRSPVLLVGKRRCARRGRDEADGLSI